MDIQSEGVIRYWEEWQLSRKKEKEETPEDYSIMSTDLNFITHSVYCKLCIFLMHGKKYGRGEMFEDMLDQELLDLNKTKKFIGEIEAKNK